MSGVDFNSKSTKVGADNLSPSTLIPEKTEDYAVTRGRSIAVGAVGAELAAAGAPSTAEKTSRARRDSLHGPAGPPPSSTAESAHPTDEAPPAMKGSSPPVVKGGINIVKKINQFFTLPRLKGETVDKLPPPQKQEISKEQINSIMVTAMSMMIDFPDEGANQIKSLLALHPEHTATILKYVLEFNKSHPEKTFEIIENYLKNDVNHEKADALIKELLTDEREAAKIQEIFSRGNSSEIQQNQLRSLWQTPAGKFAIIVRGLRTFNRETADFLMRLDAFNDLVERRKADINVVREEYGKIVNDYLTLKNNNVNLSSSLIKPFEEMAGDYSKMSANEMRKSLGPVKTEAFKLMATSFSSDARANRFEQNALMKFSTQSAPKTYTGRVVDVPAEEWISLPEKEKNILIDAARGNSIKDIKRIVSDSRAMVADGEVPIERSEVGVIKSALALRSPGEKTRMLWTTEAGRKAITSFAVNNIFKASEQPEGLAALAEYNYLISSGADLKEIIQKHNEIVEKFLDLNSDKFINISADLAKTFKKMDVSMAEGLTPDQEAALRKEMSKKLDPAQDALSLLIGNNFVASKEFLALEAAVR